MIRHPLLLVVEALASVLLAFVARDGLRRPAPDPHPPFTFALGAVGERELPDGSWAGADLLAHPEQPIDRFQLSVRPEHDAQLTIDAEGPDGLERVFPPPGQSGVLRGGVTYALPAARAFFELQGKARVRITVREPGSTSSAAPAEALPGFDWTRFALSDGALYRATERAYHGRMASTLELDLSGTR